MQWNPEPLKIAAAGLLTRCSDDFPHRGFGQGKESLWSRKEIIFSKTPCCGQTYSYAGIFSSPVALIAGQFYSNFRGAVSRTTPTVEPGPRFLSGVAPYWFLRYVLATVVCGATVRSHGIPFQNFGRLHFFVSPDCAGVAPAYRGAKLFQASGAAPRRRIFPSLRFCWVSSLPTRLFNPPM